MPTTPATSIPGYSSATASAVARRVGSATSKGTNRRSCPVAVMASSNSRVFSDVPAPTSTRVSAPVMAAAAQACSARIARSVRVG